MDLSLSYGGGSILLFVRTKLKKIAPDMACPIFFTKCNIPLLPPLITISPIRREIARTIRQELPAGSMAVPPPFLHSFSLCTTLNQLPPCQQILVLYPFFWFSFLVALWEGQVQRLHFKFYCILIIATDNLWYMRKMAISFFTFDAIVIYIIFNDFDYDTNTTETVNYQEH